MTAYDKFMTARSQLVWEHPFWGCLALKLKVIEDPKAKTAATDGKKILFNPEFINDLNLPELKGLVAHEVSHCALLHMTRQQHREHSLWNQACDFAINPSLLQAGMTLPAGALLDNRYSGMSPEAIYDLLEQQEQQEQEQQQSTDDSQGEQGSGTGQDAQSDENCQQGEAEEQEQGDNGQDKSIEDPGGCGAVIPAEDDEETTASELEAQWKAALSTVSEAHKGDMPGSMERAIKDLIDPAIDWTALLRDFVERNARNDYAWDVPDRSYMQRGLYVPGLVSEELPEVIIAIDTSGSVTEKMLDHFAAEATALLTAYETTVRVIYCDTRIRKEEVFTSQDMPIKLKPAGGGCTSFIPVFEYITEHQYSPACLIYFTDLCGDFPDLEPEYPTLWLSTTSRIAPFGDTISYKVA